MWRLAPSCAAAPREGDSPGGTPRDAVARSAASPAGCMLVVDVLGGARWGVCSESVAEGGAAEAVPGSEVMRGARGLSKWAILVCAPVRECRRCAASRARAAARVGEAVRCFKEIFKARPALVPDGIGNWRIWV